MAPSDPDLLTFIQGIAQMRGRSDALSWEWQRQHHDNSWDQHRTWRFLPWHRVQLFAFERIIAGLTGNANFALPYWDWQQNPQIPAVLFDHPVLANASRSASRSTDIAAERWGWTPNVASVFADPFSVFAGEYDAAGSAEAFAHNIVHVIVGGEMGNIRTAPNDPIFWLHHANIDRVWDTWHGNGTDGYPLGFLEEELTDFVWPAGALPSLRAAEVVDTFGLGYAYDRPYPFPYFNVDPGLGADGKVRKLVRSRRWLAPPEGLGAASARVILPSEMVAALRADSEGLLDMVGEIGVGLDQEHLHGKVARLIASAPEGTADGGRGLASVPLAAAPAFFHEGGHAGHDPRRATGWAFRFRFDRQLVNLVGLSRGPVVIEADTVNLDSTISGPRPAFNKLVLATELKTHAWVPA